MPTRTKRDPRTKEEVLNRMLSYDFDGDIRHLGAETGIITRTGAHTMLLTFPDTGTVFELSIHRPREFAKAKPETRSFAAEEQTAVEEPKRRRGRPAKPEARA